MLQAGLFHTLTVIDQQPQGMYLDDGFGGKVLLPNRQVPEDTAIGDSLTVFVYLDSEDRIIATMQRPRIQLGQAACLEAIDINNTGAFLDWGLPKDLFVPFAEQQQRMEQGKSYVVYLTEDNTGRLIGSAKLNRFIKDQAVANTIYNKDAEPPLKTGDAIKLLLAQRTDLGYKAIINHQWWGLLHNDDIRTAVRIGMKLDGYVRKVREDGKVDISLERIGHHRADGLAERIMKKLKDKGGVLHISDRSPAELIEMHFGTSKRAFKMAIGKLYKERRILIEPDKICINGDGTAIAVPATKRHHYKPTAKPQPAQQTAPDQNTGNANSHKAQASVDQQRPHTSAAGSNDSRSSANASSRGEETQKPKAPPAKKVFHSNRKPRASTMKLKRD
ncbi:S1 RNA-binding domain-containing protein [Oceanobacter sp. 4_MG-2023]|uniref:CvfB family protein n=1 Tax=Oceanobacter sp. 4_MG-2023 TaxID=3062623 RepID=UPI002733EE00|nr:S1-like domain-containing RNA-binding protein [Oceanobacter sp. 4_MG-2023]MDP2546530.1 S1-like domain-containing RNA-binding protein [Oceanobacter sp. 4_MG-2023]